MIAERFAAAAAAQRNEFVALVTPTPPWDGTGAPTRTRGRNPAFGAVFYKLLCRQDAHDTRSRSSIRNGLPARSKTHPRERPLDTAPGP